MGNGVVTASALHRGVVDGFPLLVVVPLLYIEAADEIRFLVTFGCESDGGPLTKVAQFEMT